MTVKELIARLKKLEPSMKVVVRHSTYGEWGSFDARSRASGLSKRVVNGELCATISCERKFIDTGSFP